MSMIIKKREFRKNNVYLYKQSLLKKNHILIITVALSDFYFEAKIILWRDSILQPEEVFFTSPKLLLDQTATSHGVLRSYTEYEFFSVLHSQ